MPLAFRQYLRFSITMFSLSAPVLSSLFSPAPLSRVRRLSHTTRASKRSKPTLGHKENDKIASNGPFIPGLIAVAFHYSRSLGTTQLTLKNLIRAPSSKTIQHAWHVEETRQTICTQFVDTRKSMLQHRTRESDLCSSLFYI